MLFVDHEQDNVILSLDNGVMMGNNDFLIAQQSTDPST
jgi:hypothetical protein